MNTKQIFFVIVAPLCLSGCASASRVAALEGEVAALQRKIEGLDYSVRQASAITDRLSIEPSGDGFFVYVKR